MIGYILRRLFQLVPVLFLASIAIWGMIYAVPGGPVGMMVGENATAEQVAAVRAQMGLDRPITVQYLDWLWRALQGDFGESLHSQRPVMELIAQRLPASLQLAAAATFVSLAVGVPVAILSAMYPGSWIDRSLSAWNALALGVPTFWLGILLILLFAVQLRWLPAASAHVPFYEDPFGALRNLALPAITLGLYVSGIFARFLRASLVSELRSDYVRTARAKGLPERQILNVHVLRNALLPFITIVGLSLTNFIGGAVVTEAVFTYPGIARLLINAISQRDYPLIQGVIVVILVLYVLVNLIVDVLYAYADPRIEYS